MRMHTNIHIEKPEREQANPKNIYTQTHTHDTNTHTNTHTHTPSLLVRATFARWRALRR